jgi:8-oxo-dGTP pyrophosphatase MutT (NUDIX family)
MSNELLTIYDDEMNETGVAARDEVHAKGLLHQVVHCWVVSRWNGETWLYFQQRSHTKKDFPGLYDLAVGGHIDAGEEPLAAALREMREEIASSHPRSSLFIWDIHGKSCF